MKPGQFHAALPHSPPSAEEWCGISEEEDSEYKEGTFSFTHSPYGSEGVENKDGETFRESPEPLTPETAASNSGAMKRNCNVYVSNLPSGVDDAWLRKEFGRYGLITSAKVMQAYSKKRVYAFVQFTEDYMAAAAVEGANGMYVGNYPLVVKLADRDKDKGLPNQPSNNLYISNLPAEFGVADLERIFGPFGQVSSSVVLTHPQTGVGRGVGLVRYFCIEDATAAIQVLHGKVLEGHDRPLEVKYAEDQEAKQVRKMPKNKSADDVKQQPAAAKGRSPKPSLNQAAKAAVHQLQQQLQLQQQPQQQQQPVLQLKGADHLRPMDLIQPQLAQLTLGVPVEPALQPKPVLPPPDPQASVYIGGLPKDLQVLHAYQLFAPFGALISIDLQPDPRADTSYAYIQYRWHADALYAVEQLDGAILAGRRLYSTIHSPHTAHAAETH